MRLIDADALKEAKFVKVEDWKPTPTTVWQRGWNDAVDAIMENAPTIDHVKTGEWLYNGSDGYNIFGEEFRWKKCSLCGYSYSTELSKSLNYCPNCGARMENE